MSSNQSNNAASNTNPSDRQGTGQQQSRQGMEQKNDQPKKGSSMPNEPRNASNNAQSGNR